VAARTPDGNEADPFHLGLQYLQHDVVKLAMQVGGLGGGDGDTGAGPSLIGRCGGCCVSVLMQAGVSSSELWAPEAVLLNLWALHQLALRTMKE
jgi:hypothetical protein